MRITHRARRWDLALCEAHFKTYKSQWRGNHDPCPDNRPCGQLRDYRPFLDVIASHSWWTSTLVYLDIDGTLDGWAASIRAVYEESSMLGPRSAAVRRALGTAVSLLPESGVLPDEGAPRRALLNALAVAERLFVGSTHAGA